MELISAYILAGGGSSRFGSDKARALVNGRPLISHVARSIAPAVSDITVVADRRNKYSDLGLRTITDRIAGMGPLGGLYTALAEYDGEGWLVLVSCDWVGIQVAWIESLRAVRRKNAKAVVFRGQKWEPLLALYHTSLRESVERNISKGELALWRLVEQVDHIWVPLPRNWQESLQVNTLVDFERLSSLNICKGKSRLI